MDAILKKRIETELKKAELAGIKIKDWNPMFEWFSRKITEGYKFDLISKKLKEAKYDTGKADAFLTGKSTAKAEETLAEVEALKEKLEKKERESKKASLIGYVLAAAVTSGVAAYAATTMTKATASIEESTMGIGFISGFVKAAWIVCAVGAIAAVAFLIVFLLSLRKKKEEGES